ncbi:MAG: bacterial Ig-like domain-containing protein, partial [Oscillospiraceae bacterium]|nr:bacterial Ig-like domain-containing protein [Oscillospiraceae bacterium]
GTYPVTYSLTENGVTKSFTLNVEVVEPAPTEIQLNKTDLGFAIKGETLDTNSITATLLYDYEGKTTTLKNSDLTISSPDTSAVGKFELTVSYGGFEKKVAYEVVSVTEIKNVVGIDPIVSLGNPAYESGEVEVEILLSNDVTIERTLANGVSIDDSAYNSTAVGNTTLTVKFGDAEKVITVEVVEELDELTLLSIAIQQSSLASSIFAGDSYDYSKIKVIATFNYGITKTYEIVDGVTVTTEGTTDVAGSYTIIASYTHEGVTKTAEFTVEVKAVEAIGIEICGDYKNSILLGDSFDTSGISATLIYNNGKREPVSNNALAFAIDVSTAGKKTLTVTHKDTELTCTATVTVVGIKSVTFVGINNSYRINTTIDTADIKIVIIGDNGGTYVRNFNGNATIPTLTLDTSKANEKKAYIFTYCGVEDEIDIDVYAEFEDATLESIEYTGATQVFRNDSLLGKISVKAYYTYGFTRDYKVSDGVIVSGNTDTSSVGICNITATYGEKTAEAAINVVLPKITSIYINSAPYGIKGEEYDFDSVNVTVTFENSAVAQTATLDAFADYNILASLDVTTAGTKLLTLTANGKDYTKNVTVYEIEKIIIDTNGFNNIVQVDSEFSTDGLGKILVYLIGLQEPAIRETSQFNHNVNTAVESDTYTLTTTYLGKVSEPVKIIVAKQYFVIVGVDDPTSIADWKNGTHSDKFLDSGYQYFVGDDNPFRYKLTFSMFDIINEIPDTRDLVYEGKSTVALNGVPVGSEYVTIDEINHTFHFTSLAIGKTFEITTSHKDYPEYSKSFEVSVVDGYNVHEAIELNLLTNENSSIGKSGKNQLEVLYSFLSDNQVAGINNMSYEQYVAFVNGIRGIIIHDKLVITLSDLPDDYFFVTKNGDMYIWDHQSIYNHVFTELKLDDPKTTSVTPATFNIYGNYFTIVSNNVPTVAGSALVNDKNVASNDDDDLSSSELFFFDISNEVERIAKEQNKFYAENYVVNIYALGLH